MRVDVINGTRTDAGKLGLVLPTFPQYGAPLQHVDQTAAAAEAAGADALWACDHLFWHGPTIECLTALTVAAAATERCAIGTGVLQLPLRRSAAVAKAAASLQVLSGGRLVLGVGSGSHPAEYAAAGVPFATRGIELDRGIGDLRRAWLKSDDVYAQRPAPPEIPIWIGGSSPAARRRAAAIGDGWLPLFLSPDQLAEAYRNLEMETILAGRTPASVTRAAMVFVSVGDGRAAHDLGVAWLANLYGLPPQRFARHLVAGTPEACAADLTRFRDAGAEHIAVFVADDDPVPQFGALAQVFEEVMA